MNKDFLLFYDNFENVLGGLYPVSLILTDIPYGTTQCKWDTPLDLALMWKKLASVRYPDTAVVLFAQTPFDKILGASNIKELRYEWIWEKTQATGHLNAKKMPMKAHENILVFYEKLPTYNPQKTTDHKPVNSYTKYHEDGACYGKTKIGISGGGATDRYPRDVLLFSSDKQKEHYHNTQKPVALCEYLIRTYTNPGDKVLDFCLGSGTTGVACANTGRKFIGIEKEKEFFDIAQARIAAAYG